MKSNYIANKSDQRKLALEVAKEEIERQKLTVCKNCEKNIGDQVLAVVCKALATNHGFGKKRLKALVSETQWLFDLCELDGKRYKAIDCVKWLKDSMGIDLNKP